MTRQTADMLSNNGHDYDILEVEGGDLYRPPQTVEVVSMSTACWKGFNCSYKVLKDTGDLFLTDLIMRTEGQIYPPLHGVDPTYNGFNFRPKGDVDHTNSYCIGVYKGLDLPISHFTGRIMLGTNFIHRLIEHHDATCYQHVWEIHLEHGRVTQALDLSEQVAARRRQNEVCNNDYYHPVLYRPFSWGYHRFIAETGGVPAGDCYDDDLNDDDL
mmetsp:Transcript_31892/g.52607  ORF Transcript_31892/g.52607 Transcript_31892/m.52607 type:complete len:214 (+) Transcript_31892:107-748(+)|eukprot:CAMPEP_0119011850 /NCGR_PEP_ID=MMETSP1176-20130426/5926_1 /TAXON_ID=265551 /ORGANISM="Synedropsis recta cf, Strain CCMP1620" /LENGTH=213 /DNA_ID=CAMNT_0006964723 /DNA_START=77 /DNA_END=718 /DNA_ORIENTATION=-